MLPNISRRLRVGVAMSGGVDSCVTAYLLAVAGHEVLGIHMRNWNERDENDNCPNEQDWTDVQNAVKLLPGAHPQPVETNFEKEYWQNVFTPFIDGFSGGTTPNPDVACNREIKFKVFREHALKLGVDGIATGHYARLSLIENESHEKELPVLMTARDTIKDQTYFLSQVSSVNFKDVIFPLGDLVNKANVKKIAIEAGFASATRRESMGICFIGKRKFSDFLSEYVQTTKGNFVSIETGMILGPHGGSEIYTIGQGAKIGGASVCGLKWFVCGKNAVTGDVIVAPNNKHPALYCDELYLKKKSFLWSKRDEQGFDYLKLFRNDNQLHCYFKLRHGQEFLKCTVFHHDQELFRVQFEEPMRGVSPGQVFVMYRPCISGAYVCLGGGPIDEPGDSLYAAGKEVVPQY